MRPIGGVARVQGGYSFKSQDWVESGISVVKIGNVRDGFLDLTGCSYVSESVARTAAGFELRPGDILIGMTGYVVAVAMVCESDLPALLNQRVGRFRFLGPDHVDPAFFYRAVRLPEVRKQFEQLAGGSAQPNLSPSQIESVEIPLPSVSEQRRIAGLLVALDAHAALNRRQIATMDALGEVALRWFVDGQREDEGE